MRELGWPIEAVAELTFTNADQSAFPYVDISRYKFAYIDYVIL